MATLGIAIDKTPKTLTAFRSDGRTVPFIAAGGEVVGDIVIRDTNTQQIGQVMKLAHSEDAQATAGDTIHLRIYGMFVAPKAALAWNDGDMVTWDSGNSNFTNTGIGFTTGAHEVVGGYDVGDSLALIRFNVDPGVPT